MEKIIDTGKGVCGLEQKQKQQVWYKQWQHCHSHCMFINIYKTTMVILYFYFENSNRLMGQVLVWKPRHCTFDYSSEYGTL